MTYVEAIRTLEDIRPGADTETNKALGLAVEVLKLVDNAVGEGYLTDWYINSVSQDDAPVWTDEHITELAADFIVIPKPDNGHIPVTEPVPAVPGRG